MKRRASERGDERAELVLLSVSVCDAFSTQGALFFSPLVCPQVFFPPGFLSRARREDPAGDEQRHSAGDKSRISCYGGALVRKATVPPPPLTFRGRNLSLADDPLKRICPHTRQRTALRAATREVIQRHATTSNAIDVT